MTAITIYELRNIFDKNTVFYALYTYKSSNGNEYSENFVIPNLLYGTNSFADIKVAKLHEKVANQRKDFLHKQSKQITNTYDCVCVEDLNMKAMSQSLNFGKSVSDNGWSMFTTFLKYKLEEQGKRLVKVDKFFASSQTCSCCGYVNKETKNLTIRAWDCPQCGVHHDRDVNAAINIRNEGMRIVFA